MEFTAEQRAAIGAYGENILLSAAAGSGKTTVLVERILTLVRERHADVDRMLVVTFTNAAAADMRAKLRRKLAEHAEAGDEACRQQLLKLENASISTIHAFCSAFLRENFELADVEPAFRVLDASEEKRLRESAMDFAMESAYQEMSDDLKALDEGRGPEKVRGLAEALDRCLDERSDPEGWFEEVSACGEALRKKWMDAMRAGTLRAIESGEALLREALLADDVAEGQEKAINNDLEQVARLKQITDLEEMREALGRLIFTTARCSKACPAGPQAKALREKGKTQIKELKISDYPVAESLADAANMAAPLRALGSIVFLARQKLAEAKEDRGALGYSDLEHRTLALLRTEDGLSLIREKYDYIFVDEYQDTSELQDTLMCLASRGDNLYCVGDVKQSIYRFRSAEPSLFLKKFGEYGAGNGGRLLLLNHNFRSSRKVIDFVNAVFSVIMQGGDAEITYDASARLVPGPSAEEGETTEIVLVPKGEDDAEAKVIAQLILREKRRDPTLTWRDIAVITRRGERDTRALKPALEEAGIPVYSDKEGGFYRAREIRLALSLLRLVADSLSDVDLIGVMRSPLIGLTSNDLARMRLAGKDLRFIDAARRYVESGAENADILGEWLDRIDAWRRYAACAGVGDVVRRVISESGLVLLVSGMPGGERRRANLDKLCRDADSFAKNVSPLLYRFLLNADRETESGEGDSAPTISEADDVVRIMTAHKSKGLEFRVVIAPGLHHEYSRGDLMGQLLAHRELGVGIAVYDPVLRTRRRTLAMEAINEKTRLQSAAEEMRVLYVLLTRAKDKLILTATVKEQEKMEKRWKARKALPMTCSSYLDLIMVAKEVLGERLPCRVLAPENVMGSDDAPSRAGYTGAVPDARLLRWKYPYEGEEKRPVKLTASALTRELEGPEEPIETVERPAFLEGAREVGGAERGTATHTLLRMADFESLRGRDEAEREAYFRQEKESLIAKNLLTEEEGGVVDTRAAARFFGSPEGQKILAAQEVHREWAFDVYLSIREETGKDMDGKVPVQGVIDLCYLEDGEWVLLDYKTDRTRDIEEIRERYMRQLGTYAKALSIITGRPVRRKLLCLIGMGRIIEVKDEK